MTFVTSQDGTRIAYDSIGSGPAVIVIGGGPVDRTAESPLAALLAEHFTIYSYDRRGRGETVDTAAYSVDREFDDLQALITEAGGSAMVYGTSGGAMIAIQAAARGLPITKLALWEVPYILPGTREPVPADYRDQQYALRAQGRFGDMMELFMLKAALMPAGFVEGMKAAPFWEAMAAGASCLAYDADVAADFGLPSEALKTITIPTLVIDGATTPWITAAAEAIADALPDAHRTTLHGQPHNVDAAAIAPAVTEFFGANR
ncbi:alpha/beta fold hydrolase [Sphaerisporangium perillae]|uniref:alpha/beta fold hydrolase n=1 Tax=Sphaerisporangium perillae TaxID=2935860 RepID=UPI00200D8AAE|nr:alpha/beta hydrolase [Sphaerisporangium perillae]